MKREIKFRAHSMCRGEQWVYGDLRHYARNPRTEKWTVHDPATGIETDIDETTIGQFTGLYDKNGKEIYENDIVRIYDGDYEEYSDKQVKFAHGVFGVDNWTKRILTTLSFFMGCDSEYSIEVIGNIHDNKDLL